MRLTSEQIETARRNINSQSIFEQWMRSDKLKTDVSDLLDTIKALQQENEQLNNRLCFDESDHAKTLDKLAKAQQENTQLRAVLEQMRNEVKKIPSVCRWWQDILYDTPDNEPCTRLLMDMCPRDCPKYHE
jgi:predicted nuclease with TOPRIM domain